MHKNAFQSTHSVGSGTCAGKFPFIDACDFNPPTPWGVGQRYMATGSAIFYFNPPTPWGVGHAAPRFLMCPSNFNPPTPWGVGRFVPPNDDKNSQYFNPPTPWGVGPRLCLAGRLGLDFNPPTPWGVGRQTVSRQTCKNGRFQSTHSVGSGT